MVTEGGWPDQLKANVGAWAGCITGVAVESQVSYGLENPDGLDEAGRAALTKDLDWATVPANVRLYSLNLGIALNNS